MHDWVNKAFIVAENSNPFMSSNRYQQIKYEIDPEYLFSPISGEGKLERRIVEQYFKVNYTHRFNVGRITRPGEILFSDDLRYNTGEIIQFCVQRALIADYLEQFAMIYELQKISGLCKISKIFEVLANYSLILAVCKTQPPVFAHLTRSSHEE